MNIIDLFKIYLKEADDVNDYLYRCYGELHLLASQKGIEFNGYPNTKLMENPLDEEYFASQERQNLYVLKATEVDEEIRRLFLSIYSILNAPIPTDQDISKSIYEIEESGIIF